MTSKVTLGMAVAALIVSGGSSVSAGSLSPAVQQMQNETMNQMMGQAGPNIAPSIMNGVMPGPSMGMMGAGAPAGTENQQVDLTEIVGQAIHTLPSQQRDQLATQMTSGRQLLQADQAVPSLTQQERDQLTRSMVSRNLPLLKELKGVKDNGIIEPDSAISSIMRKMQGQIFKDSYENIARNGQNTYRTFMQPQVVQRMINNIRPWEFPNRFKGQMMPLLGPKIAEQVRAQIKDQQKQLLQDGMK